MCKVLFFLDRRENLRLRGVKLVAQDDTARKK